MAGDWIPMRTDLWDCPEVVRILSVLCPQSVQELSERVRKKSEIIGALYRTWSLFDTYTDDGKLTGYDAETLDSMVGIANWSTYLVSVGWLVIEPQVLIMPKFTTWLSESAKARLKDAQRKRNERRHLSGSCPDSVRKSPDRKRTTGQERTVKKNTKKGARVVVEWFGQWWQAYPRKLSKGGAEKAFPKAVEEIAKSRNLDVPSAFAWLLERTTLFAASDKGRGEYCPHPATWLNGKRYDDDDSKWNDRHDSASSKDETARVPTLQELEGYRG